MSLHIITVPCLSDNYAYVLISEGQVAIVDPSEAEPVMNTLNKEGLTPDLILNTHHHWDHVGGNQALLEHFPDLKVFGHASDAERIPGFSRGLIHGESFILGNQSIQTLHNPGHTHGAITYVAGLHAFTGDTLFGAGCGRVFEGTMQQMYRSLNEVIGNLPENTQLYFGHEYTASNLRFAQQIEPNNSDITLRQQSPLKQATLKTEFATNPFLRCHVPAVIKSAEHYAKQSLKKPADVFAAIRQWKSQ